MSDKLQFVAAIDKLKSLLQKFLRDFRNVNGLRLKQTEDADHNS